MLDEEDFKILLKPQCKLVVFKEEIIQVFGVISALDYTLDFGVTQKYEEFLQEPKTSCFSFHFSKYIKDSNINLKKESLMNDDPITLWQQKSKTLNFNEFQMKILRKETEEIDELIHDSDFLSNFLLKYYNNTTSSKNSFESQLKKHKIFLSTLIEELQTKDPLKQKELLENKERFLSDFALVKKDLAKRMEDINYLKSHTYPNDYQKEEDDINSILMHLDYLFSFLDQIFNEPQNFPPEIPLDQNKLEFEEEENNDQIMDLDYNRISISNMLFTWSPGGSPAQKLNKSNGLLNRKRKSRILFLAQFQNKEKKFKGKPLFPTKVYLFLVLCIT